MNNLRLFIGISLSEPVNGRLSSIMDIMASVLPFKRWTHPADLHVTLHFLGDTPEDRLDDIRKAIVETAGESSLFSLGLTQPGSFGAPSAPRVLWCGVEETAAPGALASLHGALAPKLAAAGCELESRPYRPHITLARQGGRGCTPDAIESAWHGASETGADGPLSWTADRITLFLSHLGRRPSYERIYEAPLPDRGFPDDQLGIDNEFPVA